MYNIYVDKLYYVCYFNCYRRGSGTAFACGIAAGAAALVLEKHPHYTPAQVKKYLIKQATNGVIDMDGLIGAQETNDLLYVGNGM